MEPEVIASFLERVDDEIAARVDAHLEKRSPSHQEPWRHADWGAVVLAISSLGVAVPIVESANLVGEIAAWTAIVLVNIAYNRRHRL